METYWRHQLNRVLTSAKWRREKWCQPYLQQSELAKRIPAVQRRHHIIRVSRLVLDEDVDAAVEDDVEVRADVALSEYFVTRRNLSVAHDVAATTSWPTHLRAFFETRKSHVRFKGWNQAAFQLRIKTTASNLYSPAPTMMRHKSRRLASESLDTNFMRIKISSSSKSSSSEREEAGLERISRRMAARACEPRCHTSVAAATLPTTRTAFFSLPMFITARCDGDLPSGIFGETFHLKVAFSPSTPFPRRRTTPSATMPVTAPERRGVGVGDEDGRFSSFLAQREQSSPAE
jgi:hypothetical protein